MAQEFDTRESKPFIRSGFHRLKDLVQSAKRGEAFDDALFSESSADKAQRILGDSAVKEPATIQTLADEEEAYEADDDKEAASTIPNAEREVRSATPTPNTVERLDQAKRDLQDRASRMENEPQELRNAFFSSEVSRLGPSSRDESGNEATPSRASYGSLSAAKLPASRSAAEEISDVYRMNAPTETRSMADDEDCADSPISTGAIPPDDSFASVGADVNLAGADASKGINYQLRNKRVGG